MYRVEAIMLSLLLAVFVQYARAGVPPLHGRAAEGQAIGAASPTVTLGDSDGTEWYQAEDSMGTGEMPGAAEPSGEMKEANPPAEQAPQGEGSKSMETQEPTDTGNAPEPAEPKGEEGGSGSPSDSSPGSSY